MSRPKIPEEIKELVYELFSSSCGLCGEWEKRKLQIHHLDTNPENNEIENLFLACYECHAYVFHFEKAEEMISWWEETFGEEEF